MINPLKSDSYSKTHLIMDINLVLIEDIDIRESTDCPSLTRHSS